MQRLAALCSVGICEYFNTRGSCLKSLSGTILNVKYFCVNYSMLFVRKSPGCTLRLKSASELGRRFHVLIITRTVIRHPGVLRVGGHFDVRVLSPVHSTLNASIPDSISGRFWNFREKTPRWTMRLVRSHCASCPCSCCSVSLILQRCRSAGEHAMNAVANQMVWNRAIFTQCTFLQSEYGFGVIKKIYKYILFWVPEINGSEGLCRESHLETFHFQNSISCQFIQSGR